MTITGKEWEEKHPLLLALWLMLIAILLSYAGIKLPNKDAFFSSVVALGGIFSAFSVTIKSLLLSSFDKMQALREVGLDSVLMSYIKSAVDGALVLCVLGVFGFFPQVRDLVFYPPLVLGGLVYSLLAMKRLTTITTLLFKKPADKGGAG